MGHTDPPRTPSIGTLLGATLASVFLVGLILFAPEAAAAVVVP